MKVRSTAVLALLLGAVTVASAQSAEKAVTVFVTAAPVQKADKETQKEHEVAFAEASRHRKELEKTLKAQHGNKRENWPAAAEEQYRTAEDLVRMANIRRLYEKQDQDAMDDSVEDSKKGFTGAGMRSKRENVILVDTPDDAQLIVELRARRSEGGAGLFGRQFFVLAALKPGPKLSAGQFAAIPRASQAKAFLPGPRPDAPEWIFEAFGTGSWKVAGTDVSLLVGKFISDNQALLAMGAVTADLQGAPPAPHKTGAATGAASEAPQDPRASPFVHVEQDGQVVPEKAGEILLRRAPFTLVLKLPEMSSAKAHVAATPTMYELARSNRPLEMFSDRNNSMAEGDRNEAKQLFVGGSSPGYHHWFYDGPQDHRFDRVTLENDVIVGRRTVEQLFTTADRTGHTLDRYAGDTLYLTFRLEGTASGAEFRRQAIKIRLAGEPLPAPKTPPAVGGAHGVVPVRVGEGVPAPAKIKHVEPIYPPVAQSARVQGTVLLDVAVGADGSVLDAKVVRSIPLLDQAALDAVKQWKFAPPRVKGRAAPIIMTVLVNFALEVPAP